MQDLLGQVHLLHPVTLEAVLEGQEFSKVSRGVLKFHHDMCLNGDQGQYCEMGQSTCHLCHFTKLPS